jgi:hypothetical protein
MNQILVRSICGTVGGLNRNIYAMANMPTINLILITLRLNPGLSYYFA